MKYLRKRVLLIHKWFEKEIENDKTTEIKYEYF